EFQKEFGPNAALADEAAQRKTLSNKAAFQPVTLGLPTDQKELIGTGLIGVAGLSLDLSAATFQPATVKVTGVAGAQSMTARQYEAMLDPQYVANQQWEKEELHRTIDQLRMDQVQKAAQRSAQTPEVSGDSLLPSATVIDGECPQRI
ncbi:MAG: hypothetical protein GY832_35120, partial [Chloroflexi bacterium]|nr:hypothetical protein [Chloroflexota bacterium]